jgi:hypothetical protein
MTDDNLPEEQELHEQPPEQETAVTTPRRPKGNRRDEDTAEVKDRVDQLRDTFSSKTLIGIIVVTIVVASLILATFSVETGPGDVVADWTELNSEVSKLRDAVNQNAFDPAFYSTTADSMENGAAQAWMNLEIASALMATALKPEDTSQLPPQFQQQRPPSNILAGDATTIQNRLTQLQMAATYLDKALTFFRQSPTGEHPLNSLGYYRSSYSAAYVSEARLLIEGDEAFETNRDDVIKFLEEALITLPATASAESDSTDSAIQGLRSQITQRLDVFKTMSEEKFDPSSSPQTGVPSEAIYSWIGSYITAKNTIQPEPPEESGEGDDSQDSEETTPVPNPSDDGDFPLEEDKSKQEPPNPPATESRQNTPDDGDPTQE